MGALALALCAMSGTSAWSAEEELCDPFCEDRECGDGGCGGSCGDCDEGLVCSPLGSCDDEGCTDACLLGSGECVGSKAKRCEAMESGCTQWVEQDCAALQAQCAVGLCVGGAAGNPGDESDAGGGWTLDAASSSDVSPGETPSSSDGCAGGPGGSLVWMGLLALWMARPRD